MRGRFLPPSPLKQPEDVLHEERYNTVLQTVQNLWVYCKKKTSCVTDKWWPNSTLIQKWVSFTTASIILSIPCMSVLVVLKYLYTMTSHVVRIVCSYVQHYTGRYDNTTWLQQIPATPLVIRITVMLKFNLHCTYENYVLVSRGS